ncbi:hypothetical protein JQS43_25590 [Natronosporangium hydrolyticum]|uniref:DUF3618 domain-containing protein n=1 Tax=Natronosporangium hydrolyticum TaxID=2811111 RepID=A0A895YF81_9ACTN|nr:hypothetical protein [Natronosporangium hydrolyticum]QSB14775.1 hypothetical protein JQS43_25590 [Natronosporangium hydrolyticum]
MLRRKQETRHAELARVELGESLDHALRAAGHAAGGVRATVGPRMAPAAQRVRTVASDGWDSTRAALAPLSEAAVGDSKRSRKRDAKRKLGGGQPDQGRRRWPALVGLLAGGVAVGVVVAAAVRRSREQEWEEYDATPAEELPAT